MKCTKCSRNWLPDSKTTSANCPICGSYSKPENLNEGLWVVHALLGSNAMSDGAKLFSAFTDLAPDLKKERNFLKLFIDAHGPEKLYAVKDLSAAEQTKACKAVAQRLSEDWGMAVKNAEDICFAYLYALTGQMPAVQKPASKDPPAPPKVKKPSADQKKEPVSSPSGPANLRDMGKEYIDQFSKDEHKPKKKKEVPPQPKASPASPASSGSGGCLLGFIAYILAWIGLYAFFVIDGWATPFMNTLIIMIVVTPIILYRIGKKGNNNKP